MRRVAGDDFAVRLFVSLLDTPLCFVRRIE